MVVIRRLRKLGDIGSTADLLAAGISEESIRLTTDYGRIQRIRRGWYATLDAAPSAILARIIGGRLACLSALEFHGELAPLGGPLHIEVPRSASRLRIADRDTVVHWARHPAPGDRAAVSADSARTQAARCSALKSAGVASL